jgi:hypothetical protein
MMRVFLSMLVVQGALSDCLGDLQGWNAMITSGAECDPVKLNWCSDATCKGTASKLYDDCNKDPTYSGVASATKSALEAEGCEPTSRADLEIAKAMNAVEIIKAKLAADKVVENVAQKP